MIFLIWGVIILILFFIWVSSIGNLEEDGVALSKQVKNFGIAKKEGNTTFEREIDLIIGAMDKVNSYLNNGRPSEFVTNLDLDQIIKSKSSQCYHKARLVGAILSFEGFKVRNVYLILRPFYKFKWLNLFLRNLQSHSLIEVNTKKGWVVVDPYLDWISLDSDGNPISIKLIREFGFGNFKWKHQVKPEGLFVYNKFDYIFGLFSRHGQFFKPEIWGVPDINWPVFIINFIN